ncbi:MAG: pyridoxal 5'-phosphate synthase glutaminase subunit PdxT [Micrococcales bacterium]|nr:pyridoxal 5'-phosphate synthase glutaminase subunit PdxT [Micrococcales bacterium]
MVTAPLVGVLALQGAVREHVRALEAAGAGTRLVRRPADLDGLDALVMPGGESTAIARLARHDGLLPRVRTQVDGGMPVFGTCAGLILLADKVQDADALAGLDTVGGLRITARRNGFGSQLDSFEADLAVDGMEGPLRAVFIRAPQIVAAGDGVEVLAAHGDRPVLVRQGGILAATFHPELTDDTRLHGMLVEMARDRVA